MATIRDIGIKIKALWGQLGKNVLIVVVIILVALLSFGLGRASVFYGEKDEFKVLYPNGQSANALEGAVGKGDGKEGEGLPPLVSPAGQFVASKAGTSYFFPWCPLALKIAPEERVYFGSRELAERAGYHAGRCNGL